MLKDTLDLDSDEEYRFTGTETRPKEIVAVAIERAGIGVRLKGLSVEGTSVPASFPLSPQHRSYL
jgi:hypothetical protein